MEWEYSVKRQHRAALFVWDLDPLLNLSWSSWNISTPQEIKLFSSFLFYFSSLKKYKKVLADLKSDDSDMPKAPGLPSAWTVSS